jgi:hypothetical protein
MYGTLLLSERRGIATTGCGNAEAVNFIHLKILMCTVLGARDCFVFLCKMNYSEHTQKKKKNYFLSSLKVTINTTDNDVVLWPTLLMTQSGVKSCTFTCDTTKKTVLQIASPELLDTSSVSSH